MDALHERLLAHFDRAWRDPASTQYADSLGDDNARIQQQHWIGVTPTQTGIAPPEHAHTALDVRATPTRTTVHLRELTLGDTLPHGAQPRAATLDGRRVKPTNRGVEVPHHTLELHPEVG